MFKKTGKGKGERTANKPNQPTKRVALLLCRIYLKVESIFKECATTRNNRTYIISVTFSGIHNALKA